MSLSSSSWSAVDFSPRPTASSSSQWTSKVTPPIDGRSSGRRHRLLDSLLGVGVGRTGLVEQLADAIECVLDAVGTRLPLGEQLVELLRRRAFPALADQALDLRERASVLRL